MKRSYQLLYYLIVSILMLPLLYACNSGGSDFDNSLIPVQSGERWGYINLKGEYVINPQFDEAGCFFCGLALVKKGDKYGYISKDGIYVISPTYQTATSFSEDVAWVTRKGTPPILIDKKGKELLTMKVAERCYAFSEGLALVANLDEDGHLWFGYIDKKGNYKITPDYCVARPFSDGEAYVKTFDFSSPKYTAGFISKNSAGFQTIIPDSLELEINEVLNGLFHGTAIVRNSGNLNYGIIDRDGNLLSPLNFSDLQIDNGELFICRLDGSRDWGWCDKKGKIVINPQFEYSWPFASNDLAPVGKDGEFGYIDKEGKVKINFQFEEALPFIDNKVAFVKSGDKFGMIDETGKFVVNPQFDSIGILYTLYTVDYKYQDYVITDFYDLDKAVAKLQKIVKTDNVDGVTFDMSLEKILKKYKKEDLSPYAATSGLTRVDDRNIGDMFDIEVALDGQFVNYISDGWWGSHAVLNKKALPNGIQILVKPTGRGEGKANDLMKAYAKAHGVSDCDDDGANFTYGNYNVTLLPNIAGFTIMVYKKAGATSTNDPEESEEESDSSDGDHYTGKIDNKYEIVMDLTFEGGGKVTGSYYYKSKNTPIALSGELADGGMLTLEERVNGNLTGSFIGKYEGTEYSGLWVSPDGSRELSFKVTK